MTGLASIMRVGPIGPGPSSSSRDAAPDASAFRSKPAQKVPPAPVRTATLRSGSDSKRENDSRSACAVSGSTALRTPGRSMVTVRTAPSTSYLTMPAYGRSVDSASMYG
jgi:hypothetical protein